METVALIGLFVTGAGLSYLLGWRPEHQDRKLEAARQRMYREFEESLETEPPKAD